MGFINGLNDRPELKEKRVDLRDRLDVANLGNYPETEDDWWKFTEVAWPEIKDIIKQFNPDDLKKAEKYKKEKSNKLSSIFQETWFQAPDSGFIHTIPGWDVLCDLCSETYLLFEGKH